jgi:hypothetical protein
LKNPVQYTNHCPGKCNQQRLGKNIMCHMQSCSHFHLAIQFGGLKALGVLFAGNFNNKQYQSSFFSPQVYKRRTQYWKLFQALSVVQYEQIIRIHTCAHIHSHTHAHTRSNTVPACNCCHDNGQMTHDNAMTMTTLPEFGTVMQTSFSIVLTLPTCCPLHPRTHAHAHTQASALLSLKQPMTPTLIVSTRLA